MIILDTNIISELMRPNPHAGVFKWIAAQPIASLYTTHINQAEIMYGIALLPDGKRRIALEKAAHAIFTEDFAARVLPFNAAASSCYAAVVTARRRAGKAVEGFDALIAAIALAAGATLATRDIGGFEACGLTVMNPWALPE